GWDAIDFTLTRTIQLCNLPETAIEPKFIQTENAEKRGNETVAFIQARLIPYGDASGCNSIDSSGQGT
ncbi:MAG: hypothetical protein AAFS04_16570, partial [Cyanobacteria bacterium J06631_9]